MNIASTVNAICASYVYYYRGSNDFDLLNDVEKFLCIQIQRMPDVYRFVFKIMIVIFNCWIIVKLGSRFARINHSKRIEILNDLKTSKFTICRDFNKFFEMFVIFAICSNQREKLNGRV